MTIHMIETAYPVLSGDGCSIRDKVERGLGRSALIRQPTTWADTGGPKSVGALRLCGGRCRCDAHKASE
jgi:hypothetical protein